MDVSDLVYEHPADGAWNVPALDGYKMECCDCALVHTMDFVITDPGGNPVDQTQFRLVMRVSRDEETTYHKRELKFPRLVKKSELAD